MSGFWRLSRAGLVRWAAILLALAAGGPASAAEPARRVADVGGRPIDVFLYRPAGSGPFPLIVLSHGSPRGPERRGRMGARTLRSQAEAFTVDGIAVAVPIRRGYGGQGEWAEGFGTCGNPDYAAAGLSSAEDIRAALDVAAREPDIDRSRVVLVGHSAGGWGSLAAATRGGVVAVVNFAGGRGSRGPGQVCGEDRLVAAAGRFGAASRVPELWIYSRNDLFFGPELAARLHGAFVGAGGRAELRIAPAYRDDGHMYVDNVAAWKPEVDAFLRKAGILR